MGDVQLEQILKREDVPSDVKQIVMHHLHESQKKEEVLWGSTEQYQTLVETIEDVILLQDLGLNHLYRNPAYYRSLGFTESELDELDRWSRIHPDDLPLIKSNLDKLYQTGAITTEYRIKHKNGHWIHRSAKTSMIYRGDKPYAILSVIREISERKQAEKALRDSEERLRSFMEASPDNFLLLNQSLNLIEINEAALTRFPSGTKRGMVLGKNLIELSPDVEKTGRHEQYMEVLRTGEPFYIEEFVPDSKFGKRIITLKAFKVGEGLGIIATDITESKQVQDDLRKAKTRLEYLLTANPAIIYSCEPEDNFQMTFISENVTDLLGFESHYFLDNPHFCSERIHPNDQEQVVTSFKEIVEKGYFSETYRIRHKDGTYRWVLEEAKLILDDSRSPIEVVGSWIDITERKQVQEAFRKTEERLIAFMDSATDSMSLWDSNLNLIDCNNAALEILPEKTTKDDYIGKNLIDFDPRMRERKEYQQFLDVIKTGESITLEGSILYPTRDDQHLLVTAFKVGNGLGMVTTDITKRLHAEKVLQQRTHDLGERIKELNCLYRISKLTKDTHKPLDEILYGIVSLIPPGWHYPEITCSRIKYMGKVFTTDNFQETPWIQTTDIVISGKKSGRIDIYYLEEMPEIDKGPFLKEEWDLIEAIKGEVEEFIERKIVEDALKESEEKLRLIAETSANTIIMVDVEFVIQYINRTVTVSKEEVIGTPIYMLVEEEHQAYVKQHLREAVEKKEPVHYETPYRSSDGTLSFFESLATPIIIEGQVIGLTVSSRDVTQQKQLEKTRRDLEQRRASFISMTSHELRTPITVIKGYTEFLNKNLEKIDTIRRSQAIQSISRNIFRLERLIEGVADITRMDQGIFELNTSVIPFYKFLKTSVLPYQELYVEKFSIQGLVESESSVFLNIDEDRLRQVLDNLLDNANKHTPDDGKIVLTPVVLSNTIQISISDTGVGVDPNDLERIFDQFVSIETEQASGGTGIGLYVSKAICEEHGGTLTAHSEGKNQGATFVVELPRWFEKRV
ncbi:MAG: PAS domain-containing sensor histidine kinase [Candidatus Hodarchaeales archaeon]|jgi:PAS domain S-box-containing protein